MATVENRSKHIISVKNRDDLYREFPFNRENDAQAYFSVLKEQHFKPMHSRMDDAFLVRIREKGHARCFYRCDDGLEAPFGREPDGCRSAS